MTEDEAFIRTIVDRPGDDLPRLVYADWLDERGDPRGAYLRAELQLMNGPRTKRGTVPVAGVKRVRKLGAKLDGIWTARVSRPPVGVCCDHLLMVSTKDAPTTVRRKMRQWIEAEVPPMYLAFRMNYSAIVETERVNQTDVEYNEEYTATTEYPQFDIETEHGHEQHHCDELEFVEFAYQTAAVKYEAQMTTCYLVGISSAIKGKIYLLPVDDYVDIEIDPEYLNEACVYSDLAAFLANLPPQPRQSK